MAADDVTEFSVYYFNEGLRGVPQLSGTSGALIAVLDACLITGFGTVSVTSLTVADGVATATVSAGNSFNPHHIILIEGASDSALNGRHRVLLDGNSSTSFSFKTTAASGPASGTISAKYAPVPGWEKPFSAANKAVYRATTGNRFYYRVDDSLPEKYVAEIRGYETMASVDVGAAPFPLLTRISTIEKSIGANATGKYWDLVADCRAVMFGAQQLPTIGAEPYATPARYFGEMVSLAPNGDAWCSAVLSSTATRRPRPTKARSLGVRSVPSRSRRVRCQTSPRSRFSELIGTPPLTRSMTAGGRSARCFPSPPGVRASCTVWNPDTRDDGIIRRPQCYPQGVHECRGTMGLVVGR